MSYNGSGVFNINTTGQPVVSGTVISSTAFNALTNDLATGLSTALTKDGQSTPTANIKLGGYKLVNVGTGTAATDAANVGQVQGGAATYVTASGTNTITGSLTPALTAYSTGQVFTFKAAGTNTTTVTLNIDGLGAKAIVNHDGSSMVAGQIVSGEMIMVTYNGTSFQIINGTATLPSGVVNGVVYLDANKAFTASAALTFDGSTFSTTGAASITNAVTAGSAVIGGASGGNKGAGTLNAVGLYINGIAVSTGSTIPGGTLSDQKTVLTSKTLTGGPTNWVPLGSLYLSSTTEMLFFSDGSSTFYAAVYDVSSDTMGSLVSVAASVTSAAPAVLAISSTSVLLAYSTSTTTLNARILSLSGTTITANTAATLASFGAIKADIVAFGSSYVVCGQVVSTYKCNLAAMTVSGTTVTIGSVTTVYTDASGITVNSLWGLSSTGGVVLYQGATLSATAVNGFTVSGTTITVGSQVTTLQYPWSIGPAYLLTSGRMMIFYSSAVTPYLISLSGSTATVVSGTGSSMSSAYTISSGNSVLAVGTDGSNIRTRVWTDSSGSFVSSAATLTSSPTTVPSSSNTSIYSPDGATIYAVFTPAANESTVIFTVTIPSGTLTTSYSMGAPLGYVTSANTINPTFVGFGSGAALTGNTNYYGTSTTGTATYSWANITGGYNWAFKGNGGFVYPVSGSLGNYYDALSASCFWTKTTNIYYNGANTTIGMTRSQYL